MPQANNYIITNRQPDTSAGVTTYDNFVITSATELVFTEASWRATSFAASATFTADLESDLTALADADAKVSLCIYIHGYDAPWSDVTTSDGTTQGTQTLVPLWFDNLVTTGGYPGVLLAFSWPSTEPASGLEIPIYFLDGKANAETSGNTWLAKLYAYLEQVVSDMAAQGITVELQLLTHSMGNYLLWNGADAFPAGTFTQILLVAPELSLLTFSTTASSSTPGTAIASAGDAVTVYFANNDDVLPAASPVDDWDGGGLLDFTNELGISGPTYADGVTANAVGLDCTDVAATIDGALSIHTSYFYIPELLQDIALTLQGLPSSVRTGTAPAYSLPAPAVTTARVG